LKGGYKGGLEREGFEFSPFRAKKSEASSVLPRAKKSEASSGFPLFKGDGRGIYKGGTRGVRFDIDFSRWREKSKQLQ